jgi:hypothetical protein
MSHEDTAGTIVQSFLPLHHTMSCWHSFSMHSVTLHCPLVTPHIWRELEARDLCIDIYRNGLPCSLQEKQLPHHACFRKIPHSQSPLRRHRSRSTRQHLSRSNTRHSEWRRVLSAPHWRATQAAFARTSIVFPPYYVDLATLPHSRNSNTSQEQLQG